MHPFAVETTFLVFLVNAKIGRNLKLDNTGIEKLHCSKKCVQENIDCSKKDHTVTVMPIDRTTYQYRGGGAEGTKKKVPLLDKPVIP